jgi:putative membrane protein
VKRSLALSAAALLAVSAAQPVLAQSTSSTPSTDDFIKTALQSDEFERQTGATAKQSGLTQGVRDFGAMMVVDHTKTTQDLDAAIAKSGRPVPSTPKLTSLELQGINSLKNQIGMPLFDSTYLAQQIRLHQQALALMQAYAQNGEDATLRTAASNTIPIVQHHLSTAQDLSKNLH